MADPTSFSWALQDDQGLNNSVQMFVAYDALTATITEVLNAWIAYGSLIDPCVDGKITGGSITIPLIPDASWKTAAVNPGNNVNQVMNLVFNNDFNSFASNILLPSYKESLLLPDKRPDLADPALSAFIAAVLFGEPPVTPAVFPNSRDLHDLNALRDAFLTVRKVRNQRNGTRVSP